MKLSFPDVSGPTVSGSGAICSDPVPHSDRCSINKKRPEEPLFLHFFFLMKCYQVSFFCCCIRFLRMWLKTSDADVLGSTGSVSGSVIICPDAVPHQYRYIKSPKNLDPWLF